MLSAFPSPEFQGQDFCQFLGPDIPYMLSVACPVLQGLQESCGLDALHVHACELCPQLCAAMHSSLQPLIRASASRLMQLACRK